MFFTSFMHSLCLFVLSSIIFQSSVSATPVQDVSRELVNGTASRGDDLRGPNYGRYPEVPRLVIYFQTTHNAETRQPISMLPLVHQKGIALTHLIVSSFHLGTSDGVIHLNDLHVDDHVFNTLWNETLIMQMAGVKVMGMIGGAAKGSFNTTTLDNPDKAGFEHYYGQVADVIRRYQLDGLDLDVEEPMSRRGIARLVNRLNYDFGDDFIITAAPVASALDGRRHLSGFDYKELVSDTMAWLTNGRTMMDFMNTQFYSGFGNLDEPESFEACVKHGWAPEMIVAGQLTYPNKGKEPTSFEVLNNTITSLVNKYGRIGGVMGWEYFTGWQQEPWHWAQEMTKILRPHWPGQFFPMPVYFPLYFVAWFLSTAGTLSGVEGVLGTRGQRPRPHIAPETQVPSSLFCHTRTSHLIACLH